MFFRREVDRLKALSKSTGGRIYFGLYENLRNGEIHPDSLKMVQVDAVLEHASRNGWDVWAKNEKSHEVVYFPVRKSQEHFSALDFMSVKDKGRGDADSVPIKPGISLWDGLYDGLKKVPLQIWIGVLVLVLLLWGGIYLLFGATPGSTADDEVRTPRKRAADFQAWSKKEAALVANTAGTGALHLFSEEGGQKIGWWQARFSLPSEKAVRAALSRRVPEYLRVAELRPLTVGPAEDGEGVSVLYAVKFKAKDDVYAVSVIAEPTPATLVGTTAKFPPQAAPLVGALVLADDLPPGFAYRPDDRTLLLAKGQTAEVTWRVNQAAKEDGVWKVLDADPIQFEANGEYESALLDGNRKGVPAARLLRSAFAVESGTASEKKALAAFSDRVVAIETQVADFRRTKLADVPEARRDTTKFGGNGSGEPTKTGMRVVGGAAGGAGVGALAGGGEGAGWGALGGAVLGGIYDLVSKSNDADKLKKAQEADYQRQLAARNAALRKADAETAAYADQLYAAYAEELKARAEAQEKQFRAAF